MASRQGSAVAAATEKDTVGGLPSFRPQGTHQGFAAINAAVDKRHWTGPQGPGGGGGWMEL